MSEAEALSLPIEGLFWDPADETRRVRGRVMWPRRSPQLQLEGPLRLAPEGSNPLESIQAMGRGEADVIVGRSLTGRQLCLQNCFVIQMNGGKVSHPQVWSVARVYIGAATPPPKVASLEFQLFGLRDFYGTPLLGEFKPVAKGNRDRITVDWSSSPKLEAAFGQLAVRFDDDMSANGTAERLTLTATPRIHIVPPEPRPLDELRPEIGYLATLVGFCRGAAAELDELWLVTERGERVRCLERLRPLPDSADDGSHAWLGIGNLTPLAHTLERWREFCVTNENGLAMIAEYLRDPPRYMTIDRLLVLVRFLEEYSHTLIAAGTMPAKQELDKRIRWIQQRHAGALGDAMGKHGGVAVARAVADTRHYHTHFNPKYAAKAATGLDLIILIDRLWLLTRACVLSELGYDDDQVAGRLSNDPRVSWLAGQP